MVIDFRKLEGKDVDDTKIIIDLSKSLGKEMYRTATEEVDMDLGREIFNKGTIEVNPWRAKTIKNCLNDGTFLSLPNVQLSLRLTEL